MKDEDPEHDPHYKKTVSLSQSRRKIRLRVGYDLFSSHDVDPGTKLLLRSLAAPEFDPLTKVLDLGCGYGPIGLMLAALQPARRVHLVDRDALAVFYARRNAVLNRLDGVEVYPSLGYGGVEDRDFDLIASNVPAKAGPRVVEHLLMGAADHLRPGGSVAVVVVDDLAKQVSETLVGASQVRVESTKRTRSYSVFHYLFAQKEDRQFGSGAPLDLYDRSRVSFEAAGVRYEIRTVHGIGEFDTLGYHTTLAAQEIVSLRPEMQEREVVVLGPGQGHVPVILWMSLAPQTIRLVDRDLLALSITKANLEEAGCPPNRVEMVHRVAPDETDLKGAALVVDLFREKEPPSAMIARVVAAGEAMGPGGHLVLAGGSTPVTRALAASPGALRSRSRHRGASAAVIESPRRGSGSGH